VVPRSIKGVRAVKDVSCLQVKASPSILLPLQAVASARFHITPCKHNRVTRGKVA
jgi:hypothetical protein